MLEFETIAALGMNVYSEHPQSSCAVSLKAEEVERRELRFRPAGEKPIFKLHLQVET